MPQAGLPPAPSSLHARHPSRKGRIGSSDGSRCGSGTQRSAELHGSGARAPDTARARRPRRTTDGLALACRPTTAIGPAPIGPVRAGLAADEDRNQRHAERGGKMQQPGVDADDESSPCDQARHAHRAAADRARRASAQRGRDPCRCASARRRSPTAARATCRAPATRGPARSTMPPAIPSPAGRWHAAGCRRAAPASPRERRGRARNRLRRRARNRARDRSAGDCAQWRGDRARPHDARRRATAAARSRMLIAS